MVKNIVFDFGGVVLTWNPKIILKNFTSRESDIELLTNIIYKSKEWQMLDNGTITREDATKILEEKLPKRLKRTCKNIIYHFQEYQILNDDICKLIIQLKENEYNVYALSNTHISVYEDMKNRYIGKYFDGYIISALEKLMKPNKEIYLRLFEKFNLKPNECFFIDDREENIAMGENLGMLGHILNREEYGITKLLQDFNKYGIKILQK